MIKRNDHDIGGTQIGDERESNKVWRFESFIDSNLQLLLLCLPLHFQRLYQTIFPFNHKTYLI